MWPAATGAVVTMVASGLCIHGAYTASFLMNPKEFQQFALPRNGQLPLGRAIGLPLIPILLIISRTSAGDSILPFLPGLYLISNKMSHKNYDLSRRPDLWICALPALRAFYFAVYRKWALPHEKAWLQEIQPPAADNTGAQPDQENVEGGGPLDMDFELGVQIEVDAIDNGIGHHHEHDPLQLPQNQEAVNPAPADQNNDRNGDNQNGDAQPQQPPPQRPGRPVQNFVFAIPDLVRLSLGALALPLVSYHMGQILKFTLPKAWTTYTRYWKPQGINGILRSQTARTVVGGCLFIVMKDSLFLYCKYSMAQNHRKRRVLNYNEYQKPWYQKNIEELIMRR